MLYMGMCVFSLSISLLMIAIMIILHLISIIKWEILHIKHCSALGHETLICAAYLSMFLGHIHGGISHIPNDSTRNDQCPGHDMDRTLVLMMIKLQKTNTRSCSGALQGVSSHSPLWRGLGSKSASLTCQFSYRNHRDAFSLISQHSYGLVIELLSPRRQRPI